MGFSLKKLFKNRTSNDIDNESYQYQKKHQRREE